MNSTCCRSPLARDDDGDDLLPNLWSPARSAAIVVTPTSRQAASLVDALEAQGAEAVSVPVIEITEPLDGGVGLRTALWVLRDGDWVSCPTVPQRWPTCSVSAHSPMASGRGGRSWKPRSGQPFGLPVDLVPAGCDRRGSRCRAPRTTDYRWSGRGRLSQVARRPCRSICG